MPSREAGTASGRSLTSSPVLRRRLRPRLSFIHLIPGDPRYDASRAGDPSRRSAEVPRPRLDRPSGSILLDLGNVAPRRSRGSIGVAIRSANRPTRRFPGPVELAVSATSWPSSFGIPIGVPRRSGRHSCFDSLARLGVADRLLCRSSGSASFWRGSSGWQLPHPADRFRSARPPALVPWTNFALLYAACRRLAALVDALRHLISCRRWRWQTIPLAILARMTRRHARVLSREYTCPRQRPRGLARSVVILRTRSGNALLPCSR